MASLPTPIVDGMLKIMFILFFSLTLLEFIVYT